ncbi:MAG: short chain dehydrogenase [Legionellaceae bacterium]|nr:short chain dehydrogenase [Legionellaceae bacterium]
MKILVIGGTGTIGKAVVERLKNDHEELVAGRNHGDIKLDITSISSIEAMYKAVKGLDAVISTTGKVAFEPFENFTPEQYDIGLKNKLMGQVNLVQVGMKYLNDNASFTLTSGILSAQPIVTSTSASMVNGAIDAFVKAAATELPRGLRINSVSPTLIEESVELFGNVFKGFEPIPAKVVALAYQKSIEHKFTGKVFHVGYTDQ